MFSLPIYLISTLQTLRARKGNVHCKPIEVGNVSLSNYVATPKELRSYSWV